MAAERAVIDALGATNSFVILRSALMYGPPAPFSHKRCFFDWMLKNLTTGNDLLLFEDEFRTPLHVDDMVSLNVVLFVCWYVPADILCELGEHHFGGCASMACARGWALSGGWQSLQCRWV